MMIEIIVVENPASSFFPPTLFYFILAIAPIKPSFRSVAMYVSSRNLCVCVRVKSGEQLKYILFKGLITFLDFIWCLDFALYNLRRRTLRIPYSTYIHMYMEWIMASRITFSILFLFPPPPISPYLSWARCLAHIFAIISHSPYFLGLVFTPLYATKPNRSLIWQN